MNWVDNQKRGIRRPASMKFSKSKSNLSINSVGSSMMKKKSQPKFMPNVTTKSILNDFLSKKKSFENIKISLGLDGLKYHRVVSEEEIDELENTAESNLCIQSDSIEEVDRIDLEGTSSRVGPTPDEPPIPQLRTPKSETILKSPSQIISQGSCNGSPLFITGIDIDIDDIILKNNISGCSTISAISSNVITGHVSNDQIVVDSQPISMQLDCRATASPVQSSKIPSAEPPLKNPVNNQHLNESKMELSKTLLEKQVHINESLESLNLLEPGQKRKYRPESSEKSGDSKRRAHASLQNTRGSAQILEEIRSKIEAITKKHQTELSTEIFDCVSSMFLGAIVPSLSYDHNHRWDGMPSSPDSFSDRLDFQLPTSFF